MAEALDGLPPESQGRIIAWAISRYDVRGAVAHRASAAASNAAAESANDATTVVSGYSTLAEFFDAANPGTESEKALVAGYWLQKHEEIDAFESAAVNRELKNLGHSIKNITNAFGGLSSVKPALSVQTVKSGKSQQARKKYKITVAGEKAVKQMIAASNADNE